MKARGVFEMRFKSFGVPTVCLWVLLASYFAITRSFWGDEYERLAQVSFGFLRGVAALWSEPSPFAPGETILNRLAYLVFGSFGLVPTELWARIPGLVFGAITMAVAVYLSKATSWVFAFLSFFSVSLLMLSVQMRPYAGLIAAGMVSLALLWTKNPAGKTDRASFPRWLRIIALFCGVFSHLYGCCFIAYAAFRRKLWGTFTASLIVVSLTLIAYFKVGHFPRPSPGNAYSGIEILRQALGTLGNPHKASLFYLGFAILGAYHLFLTNRRKFVDLLLLGIFSIVFPILVTIFSGYFFVPRQIAGGIAVFVFFTALGFQFLESRVPARIKWAPILLLLPMALVPFLLSVVLARPPFPDQPFHRYKSLAEEIRAQKIKEVFLVDPCERLAMQYYLSPKKNGLFGEHPKYEPKTGIVKNEDGTPAAVQIYRQCWSDVCLEGFSNSLFCSISGEELGDENSYGKYIRMKHAQGSFLLYSSPARPRVLNATSENTARTW